MKYILCKYISKQTHSLLSPFFDLLNETRFTPHTSSFTISRTAVIRFLKKNNEIIHTSFHIQSRRIVARFINIKANVSIRPNIRMENSSDKSEFWRFKRPFILYIRKRRNEDEQNGKENIHSPLCSV